MLVYFAMHIHIHTTVHSHIQVFNIILTLYIPKNQNDTADILLTSTQFINTYDFEAYANIMYQSSSAADTFFSVNFGNSLHRNNYYDNKNAYL